MQNWKAGSLSANIRKEIAAQNLADNPQVLVYRQKAAVFGYNAPKKPTYKGSPPVPDDPFKWAEWDLDKSESSTLLYLDRAYEGITRDSYVTVEKGVGKDLRSKTIQVKSVILGFTPSVS